MFCGNCGAEAADGARFCLRCGAVMAAENNAQEELESTEFDKISSEFVEPDEQLVAKLGNGYFVNLMFHKVKTCNALLSDKRLYLRGNVIDANGGKIERSNIKKTIDLEDITGTGFSYSSPEIWKLVVAFITIFTIIPPIILLVSYFKGRNTLFFVEYAGGAIKFDASIHGIAESEDFEKQIRRAKNKLKEKD